MRALGKAARRGGDVRIMVPCYEAIDTKVVSAASHCVFKPLLEAGVRLFEYQPTLLHQKVITIDGEWCGIGSSNFDDRSFEINDEITVGIADRATVEKLDRIFEEDMPDCREITLEEWRRRALWKRALDRFFYLFSEQF